MPQEAAMHGSAGNSGDEDSIDVLNVIGSPIKELADNVTQSSTGTNGVCERGIKLLVPDRAGDANSQEVQVYYEPNCTRLARDTTRIYTPGTTAGSETVALTVKTYDVRGSTISTRGTHASISNATFNKNGFPIAGDGFARSESSTISTPNHANAVDYASELIVAAQTNGSSAFCGNSAGYNAVGIPALDKTFGWQGGYLPGATRTSNADGAVTWSSTHANDLEEGPIGGLSIATGTPNAACPIATPAFTLDGGTVKRTSSAALSVTVKSGVLVGLSVTRANANGSYNLTAAAHSNVWYTNPKYITGTISGQGSALATFGVNAFGDGTLTVTKSGTTYPVIDWVVIL